MDHISGHLQKIEQNIKINSADPVALHGFTQVPNVILRISPTLFDEMVKDGRMPKPVRINGRTVWDRLRLDEAFAALSDEDRKGDDPWDKVAV